MAGTKEKYINIFTDISRIVLYGIAVLFLVWLNWNSVSATAYYYAGVSETGLWLQRGILAVLLILLSAGTGMVMEKLVKYRRFAEDIVLAVCCLMFGAVCLWWVHTVPYEMEGDQLIVWYNSVLAMQDSFEMYQTGGQMAIYPQQQTLAFLYELLFRLVGSTDHRLIGYVNAMLAPFTLLFGYLSVKECSDRKTAVRFLPFMMLCLPYIIYSPYVYGDIPSVCFAFVVLWAVLRFAKTIKFRYFVVACLAGSLALMCRMNIWIFFIGMTIGLIYQALYAKSWKPFLLAVCVMLCASLCTTGVKQYNSSRSGYPVSEGMPSVLWLAMGLQFSEWGAGYYNNYSKEVYQSVGFDRELASAVGWQEVRERADIFLHDGFQTKLFFAQKLSSQWHDPLFESVESTGTFEPTEADKSVKAVYSNEYNGWLKRFTAHMLHMVYFFALVGVVYRFFQKKPLIEDIALIVFVGGFLFSIFWEAKSRYMLPYFILLQMYAAYGVTALSRLDRFTTVAKKIRICYNQQLRLGKNE